MKMRFDDSSWGARPEFATNFEAIFFFTHEKLVV